MNNITGQANTFKQFQESELLELFSRTINELVLDFDSSFRLVKYFEGKSGTLGKRFNLYFGVELNQLFQSDALQLIYNAIDRAIETEDAEKVEFEHHYLDQTLMLRVKVIAKFSKEGVLATLFIKDITRVLQRNKEQTKLFQINEKLQNKLIKNLEKSREIHRILLNALPDTIIIVNSKGEITEIQNVENVNWIFPEEKRDGHYTINDLMLESSAIEKLRIACTSLNIQGQSFEVKHRKNELFLEIRAIPFSKKQVLLVLRDITLKKAHEDAILEEKNRIESLVNNTEDLILAIDLRHRISVFNKNYAHYIKQKFGQTLNVGSSILDFLTEEEKEEYLKLSKRVLSGERFTVTVKKSNHKGEPIYWEINYSPIKGKTKPVGFTLFIKDVTARRHTQLQIETQKTLLEEVINTAPNLISLSDDEGRYKIVNKAICDLLSLDPNQIIGKSHEELQEWVISDIGKEWISKPLNSFAGEKKEELRLPLDNGQNLFFDIINKPMITAGGDFQLLKIGTNITERKQAIKTLLLKNEELSEANSLLEKINSELDKFVYSASHNLRAPLTSIMGLISLMRLEGSTSGYLQLMEKSIQRLDGFITDIISYSKNARQEISTEPIDFEILFQSAFEDLAFFNPNPKLSLQISVKAQETPFLSDTKRIEMILTNLISNAFKYHNYDQEKPYIKASVECSEDAATIIIEDNGLGIEAEHQDKVFKMFYRATEGSDGSGIGLYIVKEAVEKLKGTIKLQSAPGIGTTFTIKLPNAFEKVST